MQTPAKKEILTSAKGGYAPILEGGRRLVIAGECGVFVEFDWMHVYGLPHSRQVQP
jgi:hypothetical protein